MPRCLDPGARFELYLDSDADKPVDERPTFVFRVLSMREMNAALEDGKPGDAILSAALCDWRNMGNIPFSKESFQDVVDHHEALELLEALRLSYDAKKKSWSQPMCLSGISAATAETASV